MHGKPAHLGYGPVDSESIVASFACHSEFNRFCSKLVRELQSMQLGQCQKKGNRARLSIRSRLCVCVCYRVCLCVWRDLKSTSRMAQDCRTRSRTVADIPWSEVHCYRYWLGNRRAQPHRPKEPQGAQRMPGSLLATSRRQSALWHRFSFNRLRVQRLTKGEAMEVPLS